MRPLEDKNIRFFSDLGREAEAEEIERTDTERLDDRGEECRQCRIRVIDSEIDNTGHVDLKRNEFDCRREKSQKFDAPSSP